MPYGDYAKCPCCNKVAYGETEIEEQFGYRDMGDGQICRSARCKAGEPCKVKD